MRIHIREGAPPPADAAAANDAPPVSTTTSANSATKGAMRVATIDATNGVAEERRVSQRGFLKLIGGSLGLGLAAQLADAGIARAQTIGDPDTYLAGQLYGPGPSSTSYLTLNSQQQSSGTADAVRFYTYLPGNTTTLTKALAIRNTGNLDMATNQIVNMGSGSAMASAASLNMANGAIQSAASISSPTSGAIPALALTGYSALNLSTTQSGTLTWYGNGSTSLFTVDNAGNLTITGVLSSTKPDKYVTGGVVFILASGGNFGTDAPYVYWDDVNHRLGVGGAGSWLYNTAQPQATLSVVAAGASEMGDVQNSVASTVLRVSGGSLGASTGSLLSLGSLGFLAGTSPTPNINTGLGVWAYRTGNTTDDYTTTALVLGMDVDSTVRAGAALWLYSTGDVGVGSAAGGIVAIDSAGIATSAHQAYYA